MFDDIMCNLYQFFQGKDTGNNEKNLASYIHNVQDLNPEQFHQIKIR